MIGLFPAFRPLLNALDPETAQSLAMAALRSLPATPPAGAHSRLAMRAWGLDFPNPLGLAAGFDKDARVVDPLLGLGFGFVEAGTLTPKPQAGNPRPRVFRLPEDRAVINRMGFNSEGHSRALARLRARQGHGIVGINLGANKDSADRIADYVLGLEAFCQQASYIAVNVSSPNTPGLRNLQSRDRLGRLAERLGSAREKLAVKPPILLKIAPDLSDRELGDIAAIARGGAIDGLIVSNTTVSRPPLRSRRRDEPGGLSGAPLFALSTRQLAKLSLLTEGQVPLIGVGGVADGASAWAKIKAGASLVQLYTALVYDGPALIGRILDELDRHLSQAGFGRLSQAVGCEAERLAHQGLCGT